jgi:hypothetical protein
MRQFFYTILFLPTLTFASSPFTFQESGDGLAVMETLTLPKAKPSLGWALDPFEKLPGYSGNEEEEEEFELAGTLGQDRSGAAIIGEQVVSVGETIGSRKLRRVGSNFVLLEKGGSVIEVPLKKDIETGAKGRSIASVPGEANSSLPGESKAPVLRIEEIKK